MFCYAENNCKNFVSDNCQFSCTLTEYKVAKYLTSVKGNLGIAKADMGNPVTGALYVIASVPRRVDATR